MTGASFLRPAFVGLLALYPFAVYFGTQFLPAAYFGIALGLIVLLRLAIIRPEERRLVLPLTSLLLLYAVFAAAIGRTQALLYYPVLVNVMLFLLFAVSLMSDEPLLLRFVRLRGMKMSRHAPPYLWRLTAIWSAFFIANGLIALWTTTKSLEVWTLYNGLVSYILVGLLMLIEMIYRNYKRKSLGLEAE